MQENKKDAYKFLEIIRSNFDLLRLNIASKAIKKFIPELKNLGKVIKLIFLKLS